MRIIWSVVAFADLERLQTFLAEVDLEASEKIADLLANSPTALLDFPRRGPRLFEFDPREVREFRVERYVFRYEVRDNQIILLRIFHMREDRA
ncbi:type II toxin-antitoxin system RelE/ParE family toxin [Sphingomonas kaistensis]|uniref:Type II toxin-antitoxin system RelE/ParE family toxin n=1 Tax=Sphingomonas kaistensis TaxID=298708 RepID=A0ABZ2FWT2_9SPHN